MNNNAHLWIISGVMLWLSILAWDDAWAQKEGIQAIIIALVLLALCGLWMAAGNEHNTNEDVDHDED